MLEDVVFTPAAVLSVLAKIEELKDLDVGITETIDGKIQLQVGSSLYTIEEDSTTEIDVPAEVAEDVQQANEDAYRDLAGECDLNMDAPEPVEGGIVGELAKSLWVGGLVRLTAKALTNRK